MNNSVALNYSDNFDELKIIGTGVFSFVYEVNSKIDNKKYAIKKYFMNETNSFDSDCLEKFRKIKCDHIVNIESFWIEDKYSLKDEFLDNKADFSKILHIQMEIFDESLATLMKNVTERWLKNTSPALKYFFVNELSYDILNCVTYMHKQKLIHRDLRPENLMIKYEPEDDSFIKIGDPCLAKLYPKVFVGTVPCTGDVKIKIHKMWTYTPFNSFHESDCPYYYHPDYYSVGKILEELLNFFLPLDKCPLYLLKKYEMFRFYIKYIQDLESGSKCETMLDGWKLWFLNKKDISAEKNNFIFEDNMHSKILFSKLNNFDK